MDLSSLRSRISIDSQTTPKLHLSYLDLSSLMPGIVSIRSRLWRWITEPNLLLHQQIHEFPSHGRHQHELARQQASTRKVPILCGRLTHKGTISYFFCSGSTTSIFHVSTRLLYVRTNHHTHQPSCLPHKMSRSSPPSNGRASQLLDNWPARHRLV